ncbi:MAG: hypothetical protein JXB46_04905 [Candidatus Eisenbacteria bacterium]|nr:hypothetical protein [Candidatus Eisenbacteria bacterium]
MTLNDHSAFDLLGDPAAEEVTVVTFHDERLTTNGWLYHGTLVVEVNAWSEFAEFTRRTRQETDCLKPVHFKALTGTQKESSRTRLGIRWARALDRDLLSVARFFLLGVDLRKIDHSRFGDATTKPRQRKTMIYNRFFEIGLFTALRWFFSNQPAIHVHRIVVEQRDLPADDPFPRYAPRRIQWRESNITFCHDELLALAAKTVPEDARMAPALDALQITDVLVGGFSMVLDATTSRTGCSRVADALLPRIRKMNDKPYNARSCCWKKVAMRFFPKDAWRDQIKVGGVGMGQMFDSRLLAYEGAGQMDLFV